jgi:hypothetical protein
MAAEKLFHKPTERRARNDNVTDVIPTLVVRESTARLAAR